MGLISGRVPSVTLLIIVLSYVTNIVINIYLHLLLTSRSAVPSRFNEPTNGVATTPVPCLGRGGEGRGGEGRGGEGRGGEGRGGEGRGGEGEWQIHKSSRRHTSQSVRKLRNRLLYIFILTPNVIAK